MKIFKYIFFTLILVINKSFFYDPEKNVLSENEYIKVIDLFKERMLKHFDTNEMNYLLDILEKSNLLKKEINHMELNSADFAYFLEKLKECEFNFNEIKTILNNSNIDYGLNKKYGDFIYYNLKELKFTNEQIKSIINKDTQEFIYKIKENNLKKFIELIKEWKMNEWKINEIKDIFNHSVNNLRYSSFDEFINKIDNNFDELKKLKKGEILLIFNSEDPQASLNRIHYFLIKKNRIYESRIKEYFNKQINNKYLTNDEVGILLKYLEKNKSFYLESSKQFGSIYVYILEYIRYENYTFEKINFIINRENIEFIIRLESSGLSINNETLDFFMKLNKELTSNEIKSIINKELIDFLNKLGSSINRFVEIIRGLNVEQINSMTKYRNIMDVVYSYNFIDNWKPEEKILLFNEKNNNIFSKIYMLDFLELIRNWKAEQVISLMNKFELDFFNDKIRFNFFKFVQLLKKLTPEEVISIINNKNTNFLLKCLNEKDLNSFNFLRKLEKNEFLSILNSDNPQEALDRFMKEPLPEKPLGSKIKELLKNVNESWESKKKLINPEFIKNAKYIGIAGPGLVIVLIGGTYYLKNNNTGKLEKKFTEDEIQKFKKDNNIEIKIQNKEDNNNNSDTEFPIQDNIDKNIDTKNKDPMRVKDTVNDNNDNKDKDRKDKKSFTTKEIAIAGLGSAGLYGGYRLYNQYKKENKNKKYKSFAHFAGAKFKNLIKKIF